METRSGTSRGKAVLKVAGGKMIKVHAEFTGDEISEIRISGDFFLHPEEAIERLEEVVRGADMGAVEERVRAALDGVECVGVSPQDFATAIRMAYEARE